MVPRFDFDNRPSIDVSGTVQINVAESSSDIDHVTDIFLPTGVSSQEVQELTDNANHITAVSLLPGERPENLLVNDMERQSISLTPEDSQIPKFPIEIHSSS